jgi:hypothetical protein
MFRHNARPFKKKQLHILKYLIDHKFISVCQIIIRVEKKTFPLIQVKFQNWKEKSFFPKRHFFADSNKEKERSPKKR